jgi:hypothetical protein
VTAPVSGPQRPILLTGATGHVGGRLLHVLEEGGEHLYGLFPVDSWIFKGMLAKIADAARAPEGSRRPLPGITADLDHV